MPHDREQIHIQAFVEDLVTWQKQYEADTALAGVLRMLHAACAAAIAAYQPYCAPRYQDEQLRAGVASVFHSKNS